MSSGTLAPHAGGRLVNQDELAACPSPAPAGRRRPVVHATVLDGVKETLRGAGYVVRSEQLALARHDARFAGVLDLDVPLAHGAGLSVGVRNSVDKSFPLGFAAGPRVFVCDTLAFRSEFLVRRKHTVNGLRAFGTAVAAAVAGLASFREAEAARVERTARTELTPEQAFQLTLSASRRGIIPAVQVPKVCDEWESPRHDDFKHRTA